jgi:hypothetical protein
MWFDCPVCGYPDLRDPPRNHWGGASYEICVSCSYQFGFTDEALKITPEEWRKAWISRGMPWDGIGTLPPCHWDPKSQLQAARLWADPGHGLKWIETLAAARRNPRMYQEGHPRTTHLFGGIARPLRVIWEQQAFRDPQHALLAVSPHQYLLRCEAGSLLSKCEPAVQWETEDQVILAHPVCAACGQMFLLADRTVVAVRTSSGLWCQSYENGWPTRPPYRIVDAGHTDGLMVAAQLNQAYCPGLPFTPEDVERAIPEAARPHVTVEWHPEDDLLPACAHDPQCVHEPANIGRWL